MGILFCVCDLNLVQSGQIVSKYSFFCFHDVSKKIWRDLGCCGGTFLHLLSKGQPIFGLIQRLVQKWFFHFNINLSLCHSPPPPQLSSPLFVCVLCFESIIVLFWWRLFVALPESAEREEWRGECYSKVLGGALLIFWHKKDLLYILALWWSLNPLKVTCPLLKEQIISWEFISCGVFVCIAIYYLLKCMYKHIWKPLPCSFILADILSIQLFR